MQFDSKKYMPYLWIIIGFVVISFLYCLPQLQGKKLFQSDGIAWVAATHEAVSYHDSTGVNPLWSNSMFGGMPTYTSYLVGIKNYVQPLQQQVLESIIPRPAFFFFLAMLGFFILSCTMKFNKWLGAVGAIAYAFATYNPVLVATGHETKIISLGHMPGVLAGFLMIFNGRRISGAAVMGLFLTLMISYSHYQIVYYTAIMLLIAGIGIAIAEFKKGNAKNVLIGGAIAAIVGVISLGPSLPNILPTNEYTKYTMRGGSSELTFNHDASKKSGGLDKEYAFRWSNSIGETFCLLVPQLYGGASGQNAGTGSHYYETLINMGVPEQYAEQYVSQAPLYWGPQPFLHGPVYFGAVICFLFVLGLMVIRSPHKWWVIAVCALAIVMSWGHHFGAFNYFLFDNLPMYNKFRVPSMILVLPQLLFPFLGVWALNDIFSGKLDNKEIWEKTKKAGIITAGLALVLAIGGQMFFDFRGSNDAQMAAQFSQSAGNNPQVGQQVVKALQDDRSSLAMKSGIMSAIYIVLAGGAIWAFSRNKLKKEMAILAIGVIVAIDLIPTASKYLNEDDYRDSSEIEAMLAPRPVDAEIMKDKDPYYRVLDLSKDVYNDATQAYFHKCVGGYSPSKMETYQDLIDVHIGANGFNSAVLNMLNTKYIIFNGGPNGQAVFQPNPGACGNAWFVNEVKYVPTADEEMLSMKASRLGDTAVVANSWNPLTTAFVRNTFAAATGNATSFVKDSSAYIRLAKYGLNDISFVSSNRNEGFAVFSDIYYDKGWKAYVDGKETPIVKANYVLRALKLPAGNHTIEFKFHPDSYYKSNNLAMISSILLYLLFGAALYVSFRKPQKEQTPVS